MRLLTNEGTDLTADWIRFAKKRQQRQLKFPSSQIISAHFFSAMPIMLYAHCRRLVASATVSSSRHYPSPISFKPTHRCFSSDTSPQQQQQQQPKRKTRRPTRTVNAESVPSLSEFIHRSKVFKQYRSFVRLALFMDHHGNNNNANSRGECRAALEEVRAAYRMGVKKGNVDALSRTMAFTEVSVSLCCQIICHDLHSQ